MKELIEVFTKIQQISPLRLKIYTSGILFGTLMLVPDIYLELGHHLIEFLHIIYEGLCYMLEELLGHSLHLSKHESQLILFYAQIAIGGGLAYKTWRAAPRLYRRTTAQLRAASHQLIKDAKRLWAEMPSRKRIKVLAGCVAGMFGLYFWATS
jgi:hypothetical protein